MGLLSVWKTRLKLRAKGNKLLIKGNNFQTKGKTLWAIGEKFGEEVAWLLVDNKLKVNPLQPPIWANNYKLKAKLDKYKAKADSLWAKGKEYKAEGDKLYAKGRRYWAEGNKLKAEGDSLWATSILDTYGNILLR